MTFPRGEDEDVEQVPVALKLHSDILIQPVVQPASQQFPPGKNWENTCLWKVIKGKGGSEETSWGASLMIKEAHVTMWACWGDVLAQTVAYFTPYAAFLHSHSSYNLYWPIPPTRGSEEYWCQLDASLLIKPISLMELY